MKFLEALKELTLKDVAWLVVLVIVLGAALPKIIGLGADILGLFAGAAGGK